MAILPASASLSGAGSLPAIGSVRVIRPASASLSGAGSLTVIGVTSVSTLVTQTAIEQWLTINSTAQITQVAVEEWASTATVPSAISARFSGVGSLTVNAGVVKYTGATLNGTGLLRIDGLSNKVLLGLAGYGQLTVPVSIRTNPNQSMVLAGIGSLSSDSFVVAQTGGWCLPAVIFTGDAPSVVTLFDG